MSTVPRATKRLRSSGETEHVGAPFHARRESKPGEQSTGVCFSSCERVYKAAKLAHIDKDVVDSALNSFPRLSWVADAVARFQQSFREVEARRLQLDGDDQDVESDDNKLLQGQLQNSRKRLQEFVSVGSEFTMVHEHLQQSLQEHVAQGDDTIQKIIHRREQSQTVHEKLKEERAGWEIKSEEHKLIMVHFLQSQPSEGMVGIQPLEYVQAIRAFEHPDFPSVHAALMETIAKEDEVCSKLEQSTTQLRYLDALLEYQELAMSKLKESCSQASSHAEEQHQTAVQSLSASMCVSPLHQYERLLARYAAFQKARCENAKSMISRLENDAATNDRLYFITETTNPSERLPEYHTILANSQALFNKEIHQLLEVMDHPNVPQGMKQMIMHECFPTIRDAPGLDGSVKDKFVRTQAGTVHGQVPSLQGQQTCNLM